jgi:hypothetical protein
MSVLGLVTVLGVPLWLKQKSTEAAHLVCVSEVLEHPRAFGDHLSRRSGRSITSQSR